MFHYFLGTKKLYASEGYVTTFDFLSKIFCLTVPKCFVGEPCVLCFRKFPIAKNFMDRRRGVSRFPVEVFCLTVPKISVGGSLYCFTIVGYRKVWIRGGGIKIFRRNFFPS